MTLRARLLWALLALALIPTAIYTLFTLDQLQRAMGRWYRPGVDKALESAVEITKVSLARLESIVLQQSDDWSASWAAMESRPDSSARRLRRVGLDFLQLYERRGGSWVMLRQEVAEGMILPADVPLADEIPAALAGDRLIRSRSGALAAAAALGTDRALVVGIVVNPDFFGDAEGVALGMTHYRRLGVYVDVERRVVAFLVGGVVVGLILLAVLLARRLARDTARPIGELSAAIERVAAGDLDTRVNPSGAVELRSLGASFNTMASRLAEAREALQRAEREAAWRDVARKLAHEFKNILTPMQLSLQLLGTQVEGLAEAEQGAARKSLDTALREVAGLGRLAEQFSQYARLPEPRFEGVDLADVVRSAASLAPTGRVAVAVPPGAPVVVRADPLLLSRAVHNLVLNSCEASPAQTPVEVRVSRDDHHGSIQILDGGPGLPAGLGDKIFEPYVSTKQRGSGLGLSLVRDIVRQHGGTIALTNRAAGGAEARITLPLLGNSEA